MTRARMFADTFEECRDAEGLPVYLLPGGVVEFDDGYRSGVTAWFADYETRLTGRIERRLADDINEQMAAVRSATRAYRGPLPAGRCAYCLQLVDRLVREHIVPVTPLSGEPGDDHPDNIVAICQRCNVRKSNGSLLQFVASPYYRERWAK